MSGLDFLAHMSAEGLEYDPGESIVCLAALCV